MINFDFHEMCKGMRYENIAYLLEEMKNENVFDDVGYGF